MYIKWKVALIVFIIVIRVLTMSVQEKTTPQPDKVWPQVLTICVACMSSITVGAEYVWTSPFIVKITKDKINYNITEDEASYFAIIQPLSGLIFALFVPVLNDVIGRKRSLMLIAIPQIAYWIITAFATNVNVFYVARVVGGLADALHFSAIPMYIAEISTPRIRGTWGNLTFYMCFGQFLVNLVGQHYSVWVTSYIGLPVPILFAVLMFFMPESPYYCAMKNKEEEGKKCLRFLRGKTDVDEEYAKIKADVARQMSERGKWKDLILIKSNRKAVLAGIFLRASQQFSGCTVFQSYTQFIFEKSGSSIDPGMSTLIVSGLQVCLLLISSFVADNFGRKKTYICSILACGIILLLESLYFYLDQTSYVDVSSINWFPLAGLITFTVFGAVGLLTVPTLMVGELFSNSIKTKGVGVLAITLSSTLLITNAIFYELSSRFGLFSAFFFFGICSMVSTVLSVFIIPETKGKTLEEIQQDLKKKKTKKTIP